MKFVDSIEIRVASGQGGRGMASFHSAHNQPRLGPDGGDGGRGGGVYMLGDPNLNTLSKLYFRRLYKAEDGEKGGTNGKTGRTGEDLLIPVPLGTVAFHAETGEKLCEVLDAHEKVLLAAGGHRGLGNLHFVSPTHQAPEEYTKGGPSIELDLRLELKLIADVGFAGFPNAGKSTLLSTISAARPKIADYPFTTLVPNLGVVDIAPHGQEYWGKSFVAADIPGLIEGASEGKGLGHEFLRHLERTKIVAYIIATFDEAGAPVDLAHAFAVLRTELASYSEELAEKPYTIVLTKADLAPDDFDWDSSLAPLRDSGAASLHVISAAIHQGLDALKQDIYAQVENVKNQIIVQAEAWERKDAYEGYEFLTTRFDEDLLG